MRGLSCLRMLYGLGGFGVLLMLPGRVTLLRTFSISGPRPFILSRARPDPTFAPFSHGHLRRHLRLTSPVTSTVRWRWTYLPRRPWGRAANAAGFARFTPSGGAMSADSLRLVSIGASTNACTSCDGTLTCARCFPFAGPLGSCRGRQPVSGNAATATKARGPKDPRTAASMHACIIVNSATRTSPGLTFCSFGQTMPRSPPRRSATRVRREERGGWRA